MGMLDRIRSRDDKASATTTQMTPSAESEANHRPAAADSSSLESDDGEAAAPPPYEHNSTASKTVLDEKEAYATDIADVLDVGSIWVDLVKREKRGTRVTRRDTGEVYCTFCVEKRWTNPTTHFYRGHVSQEPSEKDPAHQPYCIMKMRHLLFRDTNDQIEPTKMKNREFLRYSTKWFGTPNTFTVNGSDYRIRTVVKSWTGKLILTLADDPLKTICVFRPGKLFKEVRSSIEVLPVAISTSQTLVPHALIHDNKPTKLFELALVSEMMVRINQQQNSAAASSAAAASSSAAC